MNMITDKNTSSSNYELSSKQGYDAKNHMEFFCFGSLVLEDSGRQGSSIHYLMSAWQMTKTVRLGWLHSRS